ncbi:restriction endonuclease subunit S [Vibrio owensii]|uniref:Type I restriction-modification enzyme S subunit n=1 Tax=Vibrio owensii CAIM 1854 = LMG 25443 TaxID=1229493 RepID=A0A0C1ZBR3_9VIBR|nr:restriction endonuclease subunit S [Vibrio owensii]KIF53524.1 type I restriction-modification enzyme S subunit [Vibrio owensii CAIM 1854 = LMG 25443]
MTEQVNVPKLRFGEFNEALVRKTLKEVTEKIQDGTHFSPPLDEAGTRLYLTSKNIRNGFMLLEDIAYISELEHKKIYKRCDVKKGDVLLTKDGASTGNCCINTLDSEFSLLSSVALIRADENNHNNFIYQSIASQTGQKLIRGAISGQAITRITLTKLRNFMFCFPPLPEQQKIASFLSKVDEKITLLTEKKTKLTEYKKGVMQQLFDGKWQEQDGQLVFVPPTLRFKADDGSKFPDWKKSTLGDIGKVKMCKRIMANQTSESGDIPFFKIGTFGKEPDAFISHELYNEYRHKFSYPNVGDILMSASGTLGRTVVYDGSPAYFQDSNIVWIENDGSYTTNEFLFYVYQIVKYQSEGGTIQRLYNNIILSAAFDNPSLKEQKKIVEFLSAIDRKIELANSELEKAKEWKKGLLQQMFV